MAGNLISCEYTLVSSHGVTWLSAVSRPGGWLAGQSADLPSACGNQILSKITANHLSPQRSNSLQSPGKRAPLYSVALSGWQEITFGHAFPLISPPPNLSWALFGTTEQQLTRLGVCNPKNRHTHATTHVSISISLRMILKKIYFLNSDPKSTLLSVLTQNLGHKKAESANM